MAEKLFTPEEVADMVSVSPATVRAWLRDGLLKGVKLGGKKIWRIKEKDLQEFINREVKE